MPLVRIDLVEGKGAEYGRSVGEVVYDAMLATIACKPPTARFEPPANEEKRAWPPSTSPA